MSTTMYALIIFEYFEWRILTVGNGLKRKRIRMVM